MPRLPHPTRADGLGRSKAAYDRFCTATDLPLTVLALLWLPVLVIPFAVHLNGVAADSLRAIDYLVWALFAVEYLAKFYLVPSRRSFVTHHLIDLAVIVLPIVRPIRALRLIRLLQLTRVAAVLATALHRAKGILTHGGLHFVLLTVLGFVFVCSGLELAFEQSVRDARIHTFGDALWWAVVTVTTVGYGDKYPVSAAGRGVAVVLMLVGIGLIGVLTATVASYLVEERADQDKDDLIDRLDRIEAMLAIALDLDRADGASRGPERRGATGPTPGASDG